MEQNIQGPTGPERLATIQNGPGTTTVFVAYGVRVGPIAVATQARPNLPAWVEMRPPTSRRHLCVSGLDLIPTALRGFAPVPVCLTVGVPLTGGGGGVPLALGR